MNFGKMELEYFCVEDWTGVIGLELLRKISVLARQILGCNDMAEGGASRHLRTHQGGPRGREEVRRAARRRPGRSALTRCKEGWCGGHRVGGSAGGAYRGAAVAARPAFSSDAFATHHVIAAHIQICTSLSVLLLHGGAQS
jgi:hypothetical protein